MSTSILRNLIREILSEGRKLIPRPPGYEEALQDTTRSAKSVADEFGLSTVTVLKDKRTRGIVTNPKGFQEKQRLEGYEEALQDTTRSSKSVADEFGINPSTVNSDRRKIGAARPAVRPRLERAAGYEEALRDTSRSQQSVADEFGFNAMTVFRDRKAAGIQMPRGGSVKSDRPPGYEDALHDETLSAREISKKFGISNTTVSSDRRDLGIIPGWQHDSGRGKAPGFQRVPRSREYNQALLDIERSNLDISQEFGIHHATVARDREKIGSLSSHAQSIRKGQDRFANKEYVSALREKSRTSADISREFGYPYYSVHNDRLGIDLRDDSFAADPVDFANIAGEEDPSEEDEDMGVEQQADVLAPGSLSQRKLSSYEDALRDTSRSQKSVADEFGFSSGKVLKDRRAMGIVTDLTGGPKKSRPAGYDDAMRDTNRSSYDVASEFGINPSTVNSDRRQAGVVTGLIGGPARGHRSPEYEEAIRDVTRTLSSIHDEFGIPRDVITGDRAKLGIDTGRAGGIARRQRPEGYDEAILDTTRSLKSIADEFGVSDVTVLRDRRRAQNL